jgi:mono/diheme cytochrome c family protein
LDATIPPEVPQFSAVRCGFDPFKVRPISRWLTTVRAIAVFFAAAGFSHADPTGSDPLFRPPNQALYAPGRFVYQRNCLACHGAKGDGNGELVRDWSVLPRDFRRAEFKYRSTPYGQLPANEDLARTIRHGVTGTAMPAFAKLTDREIRAVIEYIKFFSADWNDERLYSASVKVPAPPEWFARRAERASEAARGAQIFQKNCAPCHGESGDGKGPSAATLRDSQDRPIQPADLRNALRSGSSPEDTWRTVATGLTGTPMVGFLGALSSDEIWSLVAFVRSLRQK